MTWTRRTGCHLDRGALLCGRLLTLNDEAWLEGGQAGFHGLPWVVDRQQKHTVSEMLDHYFGAGEAVCLGQTDGLAAA